MATSKKTTAGTGAKKSTTTKSTTAKSTTTKSTTAKSTTAKKTTPATTEKKTATKKPAAKTATKATPEAVGAKKPAAKEAAEKKTAKKGGKLPISLGKVSGVVNALAGVKALAEEKRVDYIGVLKKADFMPTAVEIPEEESVRAVLARLGALPKPEVKKVEAVKPQNVNTGAPAPKKAKKVEDDEFLKRKSSFSEDSTEIPKDFSPLFVIGRGKPEKTGNSKLLSERFGWKYGYPVTHGVVIEELDGKKVGLLSRLRLDDLWVKAQRMLKNGEEMPLKASEYAEALKAVKAHIGKAKRLERDTDSPLLVEDLFEISELEFRALMLPRASEFIKVARLACLYDIEETQKLLARWRKIKRYKFKLPLAYSTDSLGIFSDRDVKILNSRDIYVLNDIKAHNIVELKNFVLEKDFQYLVEEINAAYKEDKERRRDAKYRTYPFVFTTVSLIFAIFLSFTYKYTIIKDALGAQILNNTFVMWLLGLAILLVGVLRSPKRRKKNSGWRYFTKKVVRKTVFTAALSIFAIASSLVFFQRYDGYNRDVYYRFNDDTTISVAGLVNGGTRELVIPESIDGYAVVGVDYRAFADTDLEKVSLPVTVEAIDKYAFKDSAELSEITVRGESGIKTLEAGAFEGCSSLKTTEIFASVVTFGKGVIKDSGVKELDLTSASNLPDGAFKGAESLSRVKLPATLDTIPPSCFEGCMYLTEISGWESVRSVGKSAFKDCMGISELDLASVEVIGTEAFLGCISLTEIEISDSASEIGKNAFKGCNNVLVFKTPFIGKNFEDAGKYSFSYFINCNNLKKPFTVVLKGMEVIRSKAFENCSAIVAVEFGETLKTIEAGAFKGAESITSITLPASLTTIDKETFKDCTSLAAVNGLENVSHIEKSAFEGCTSLTEVDLSSVVSMGENAFAGCSKLSSVKNPLLLTDIPRKAFYECYYLKSYAFDSVKTIGKEAFAYSSIIYPAFTDTLKEIGESAFKSTNISELKIPKSVTAVGKNAFAECYSLKTVEAPFFGTEQGKGNSKSVYGSDNYVKYITVIGKGELDKNSLSAFKSTLVTLSVDDGITKIADSAFKNFTMLNGITLSTSVKTIGKSAFEGCSSLRTVSLYDSGVTEIGNKAFYGSGVESFAGGSSLRIIGEEAFAKTRIRTLELSETQVTEIGKKALYGCERLDTVRLPGSVEKIADEAFSYCSRLYSIALSGVDEIGKRAFKDCDSLTEVTLTGVKTIGEEAFFDTNIVELYIENGCTSIGKAAFKSCVQLDTLSIPSSVKEIGKEAFGGCRSLRALQIPFVGTSKDSATKLSALGYVGSLRRIVVTDATKLVKEAFEGCSNLDELMLSGTIKEIGNDILCDSYSIDYVYMPISLQKFEEKFPEGCEFIYN